MFRRVLCNLISIFRLSVGREEEAGPFNRPGISCLYFGLPKQGHPNRSTFRRIDGPNLGTPDITSITSLTTPSNSSGQKNQRPQASQSRAASSKASCQSLVAHWSPRSPRSPSLVHNGLVASAASTTQDLQRPPVTLRCTRSPVVLQRPPFRSLVPYLTIVVGALFQCYGCYY